MGYLEIGDGGPDFVKGVVSFWFRVPGSSLGSVHSDGAVNLMNGCVPLIMFGQPNQNSDGGDLGPSFIGVSTNNPVPGLAATMHCNTIGGYSGDLPPFTPPARDYFSVQPSGTPPYLIPCASGVWHHLMFSFDFSGGINVSVAPRATWGDAGANWMCWVVLDGHNFSGPALASYGQVANNLHGGPNQMDSRGTDGVPTSETWVGSGSYSVGGQMPSSSHPIGIPGTGAYSSFIKTVEMAEMQIYTGVNCQTSSMFIAGGKPAALATAVTALGKTPIVYLGGSSDKWIAGDNLPGGLNSIGNFSAFGTITSYSPGPGGA